VQGTASEGWPYQCLKIRRFHVEHGEIGQEGLDLLVRTIASMEALIPRTWTSETDSEGNDASSS
jgi:hypothetical protein